MIVTYLGGQHFKMQFGDMTIAFNPPAKDSKLKSSRFGADIVLVSLNHVDFNGSDQLEFGEKKPFVISGPGEYEVGGVFIKGFKSKSHYAGKERLNTIYTLSLDNINMCFLGALDGEIDSETLEAVDEIDLLFAPISGEGVLTPAVAYKTAVKLETKAVVPIYAGGVNDKVNLKTFLKEAGEEVKSVDKLTVKKKDFEGKEMQVIVLEPVNN